LGIQTGPARGGELREGARLLAILEKRGPGGQGSLTGGKGGGRPPGSKKSLIAKTQRRIRGGKNRTKTAKTTNRETSPRKRRKLKKDN